MKKRETNKEENMTKRDRRSMRNVLTVRRRVALNNARAPTLLFSTCVHGSFVVRVDDRAVYYKMDRNTRVRFDPREDSMSGNV